MKERIYTIPINEAFDKNCECAICSFEKQQQQKIIEYTLGASMMEPDFRIITNELGFCEFHTSMLIKQENKLSYALVLKTHMNDLIEQFENMAMQLENQPQKSFFSKQTDIGDEILKSVNKRNKSCAVCKKLSSVMESFVDNIIYIYERENEFKTKFENSKGFCIRHFEQLLNSAKKHLNDKKYKEFSKMLFNLQITNLKRVRDDVDWFTKKFDYRYKNEDWKNSRDSVPRASTKISGYYEE